MKTNKKFVKFSAVFFSFFVLISTVYASVTPSGHETLINANQGYIEAVGMNHMTFYDTVTHRWYAIIAHDGGTWIYAYYAYTDANNITSWNIGQVGDTSSHVCDDTVSSSLSAPATKVAMVYDHTNNKGHVIIADDVYEWLEYWNFTINPSTGVLQWGTPRILYDVDDPVLYSSVDICLTHDLKPAFVYKYAVGATEYMLAGICDDTDGGASDWWMWNNTNVVEARAYVSLIPRDDDKILILSADSTTDSTLKYIPLQKEVTANGTTFTALSSQLLASYVVYSGSQYIIHYGSTYNYTHACISFSAATDDDAYSFIWDLNDLSVSDEYLSIVASNSVAVFNGVTFNNNEFCATALDTSSGSCDQDLQYCEQTTDTGDNFNYTTNSGYVLEDFYTDDYDYTGCSHVSKWTDENNKAIMFYSRDIPAALYVTDFTFVGQYSTPAEEEQSDSDIIWLWLTDRTSLWMGLIGALMMILSPLFMVKAFMDHDYQGFAIALLIMSVVGFAFVIGWLYG